MKKLFWLVIAIIGGSAWVGPPAYASDSIQVRPLIYRETLTPGQAKRGVVDVANASNNKVSLHVTIKFFKQVDDGGTLQFYDRPDEAAGITPEYTDFDLEPKEVLRLAFTVDSAKLPQGDVFAALMVSTQNKPTPDKQAITPNLQVGTLLVLQNGKPGPRRAEISHLTIPAFQIGGDKLKGTAGVTNPADPAAPTGFFPQMKVRIEPWGASTQFEGPLVYAGRTRAFDFSVPSDQFGVYKVTVAANDATESRYIFLMTGKWLWLGPLIFGVLGLIAVGVWIYVRRHGPKASA